MLHLTSVVNYEIINKASHWIVIFLLNSGFQFDYVFDWTILKYQQSQIANPPTRPLVSDLQNLVPF